MLRVEGQDLMPHEIADRAGVTQCILCGSRRTIIGVFVPDADHQAELVGATMKRGMAAPKEGKRRIVVYALCDRCYDRPDCVEAVEERIFAPVRG